MKNIKYIITCLLTFYLFLIQSEKNELFAQLQFEVIPSVVSSDISGANYGAIAFSDIDGDNDSDFVISGNSTSSGLGITILYTNDGQGFFTEVIGTPFPGLKHGTCTFHDIDGDNDMDLFLTGADSISEGNSKLYTNDGNGNFTEDTTCSFLGVYDGAVEFADIDGDNDADLIITGYANSISQSISRLYINNGFGSFAEMPGTTFLGVTNSSVAFSDIEGDSDVDLIITGQTSSSQPPSLNLYINDGSGIFTEDTITPFPDICNGSIEFVDIDGDFDEDLFVSGCTSVVVGHPRVSKLFSNDGFGNFSEILGTPFEELEYSSSAFSDIDGDNDLDLLLIGKTTSSTYFARLYRNDSVGVFTTIYHAPLIGAFNGEAAFADIDNDNDNDILITGLTGAYLYPNQGDGTFLRVPDHPLDGVDEGSVGFADIDNDNDMDILITGASNYSLGISKLYKNDGAGNYRIVKGTLIQDVYWSALDFADIDNDNDMDVFVSGWGDQGPSSILYRNDGIGNFTLDTTNVFEGVYHSSVDFADVDNDSDMDLLISGKNSQSQSITKLYINDGSGNFIADTLVSFEEVYFGCVKFADIDNDNDKDLLITGINNSATVVAKLYINDGFGNFALQAGTPFYGVCTSSIDFADVDGDNDLDIVISGKRPSYIISTNIYINNGGGSFSQSSSSFLGVMNGSVAFSDFDGDNDQDLIVAGGKIMPSCIIYANDGIGNFTQGIVGSPFEHVHYSSIALADVDNDNDIDILISGRTNMSGFPFGCPYKVTSILYRNKSTPVFTKIKDPVSELSLDIYPNPCQGVFTIEGDNIEKIIIYNIEGQRIYKKFTSQDINNINIRQHPKGLYFVRTIFKEKSCVNRLLYQ